MCFFFPFFFFKKEQKQQKEEERMKKGSPPNLIELRLQEGSRIAGGEALRHIALKAAAQTQTSAHLQEVLDAIEGGAALQVGVGLADVPKVP